ncbi:hypothetical protein CRENBAI_011668 [Crenichthys baileyi]|uniref:Secreted protein n=1 Tax=Crenichthys baileyi TaxID=28760 RepID=A0AAV9SBM0_9TELE
MKLLIWAWLSFCVKPIDYLPAPRNKAKHAWLAVCPFHAAVSWSSRPAESTRHIPNTLEPRVTGRRVTRQRWGGLLAQGDMLTIRPCLQPRTGQRQHEDETLIVLALEQPPLVAESAASVAGSMDKPSVQVLRRPPLHYGEGLVLTFLLSPPETPVHDQLYGEVPTQGVKDGGRGAALPFILRQEMSHVGAPFTAASSLIDRIITARQTTSWYPVWFTVDRGPLSATTQMFHHILSKV